MHLKGDKRFFLTIVFLSSALYFCGQFAYNIYSSVAIVFSISIILSFGIAFGFSNIDFRSFKLSVITILCIVVSYIVVGGGVGSLINNITSVIFIMLFYKVELEKKDIEYLVGLFRALHIWIIIYTLFNRINAAGNFIGAYNTNTIAMQILFHFVIFNISVNKNKAWYVFEMVSCVALIIYSKSRTSLIAILIMLLLLLFFRKRKVPVIFLKIGYWVMAILGYGVPVMTRSLYLTRNSNSIMNTLFTFSQSRFNKSVFTGREYRWILALDQLESSPTKFLLGIGSHYYYGSDLQNSNFHSSLFSIIICCGIIGYTAFMCHLYHLYSKDIDLNDRYIRRSKLIYLCILFVGLFESTLFYGSLCYIPYLVLCIRGTFYRSQTNE